MGKIEEIDTPDQHITFIRSEWRKFAAFAWEKYLTEGRGAIVVDLRSARIDGPNLNVPTSYIAEASAHLQKLGGWPNEEVAEVIKEYDPEQDVIFIFLRLDGDVFHYNASDEPAPPEAPKSKRAKRRSR